MGRLFDEQRNAQLVYYMAIFGHEKNKFVIISKLMRPYTPKQLSNYWRDYADPRLCRKSLGKDEKEFVIRWIQNNRPNRPDNDDAIPWKRIARSLEATFNKTYSTNHIKNFWYSDMRKKGMIKKRKATKPRIRSHSSETDFNQTDPCPTIVNPPETDVIRSVEPRPKDFILTTPIKLPNPKPNQFNQNQYIPCDLSHFTPQFNPTAIPEGHNTTHTSTPYESKILVEGPVESGFIAGHTTTHASMPYGSNLPVEGSVEPRFVFCESKSFVEEPEESCFTAGITTTHTSPYKPIARRYTDTSIPYRSQFSVEESRSMPYDKLPVESVGRTMTRTSKFMPYKRHTMPGSLSTLEPQIIPAPDFPDFNVSSINSSL